MKANGTHHARISCSTISTSASIASSCSHWLPRATLWAFAFSIQNHVMGGVSIAPSETVLSITLDTLFTALPSRLVEVEGHGVSDAADVGAARRTEGDWALLAGILLCSYHLSRRSCASASTNINPDAPMISLHKGTEESGLHLQNLNRVQTGQLSKR